MTIDEMTMTGIEIAKVIVLHCIVISTYIIERARRILKTVSGNLVVLINTTTHFRSFDCSLFSAVAEGSAAGDATGPSVGGNRD